MIMKMGLLDEAMAMKTAKILRSFVVDVNHFLCWLGIKVCRCGVRCVAAAMQVTGRASLRPEEAAT